MWEWLKLFWEDPTQNFAAAYLAERDGDPAPGKQIEANRHYRYFKTAAGNERIIKR